jgi:hypothetical protein
MTLIIAATATLAAGYLIACAIWPFASCWHCEQGKKRSPSGKAWRTCRRCKGSGARLRIGRRLWNAWSGIRRDAS